MHASNKTVSEDEEEDDVFSPTGGVFTYVSSDTSHAEGVPRSDPQGTQFEFPWRGSLNTTALEPIRITPVLSKLNLR